MGGPAAVPEELAESGPPRPALLRDLEVGDTVPDGPPGTAWYVVAEVEALHTLVLRSTTHLPPGWRDRFGAEIDWTGRVRLTARLPPTTV